MHIAFPIGIHFGWGNCGRYISRCLSELTPLQIAMPFYRSDVTSTMEYERLSACQVASGVLQKIQSNQPVHIDGPLLQAIDTIAMTPIFPNLTGSPLVGYTFFEVDVLLDEAVSALANFDLVIAGSRWCESILNAHGCSHTATVIQGIDPEIFFPGNDSPPKDRFTIFSGGKFELRKGQDLVIRAFRVFKERYQDAHLLCAWFNPWEKSMDSMQLSPHIIVSANTGGYFDRIREVLVDNGISLDDVTILPPKRMDEMVWVYRFADVGLFPNRCEGGTNLVLMEFMATGKPAIATDTSGHKDILTDRNAMLLECLRPFPYTIEPYPTIHWEECDVDEIVAKLEWAYHHRSEVKAIGMQAAYDMQRLTWEASAKKFLQVIDQLSAKQGT